MIYDSDYRSHSHIGCISNIVKINKGCKRARCQDRVCETPPGNDNGCKYEP